MTKGRYIRRNPLAMWQKRIVRTVFVWLAVSLTLVACGPASTIQEIKIKGSDTVLPITQKVVENYKKKNPSLEISVTGGGSGVGIAALLSGTTDIAMASRRIKLSERLKLKQANVPYVELIIAYDALALAVHPGNPVNQLTRQQLEAIYTGEITNWKQVGGQDMKIVVYSRENSSGTHEFFKEIVLEGREFASTALMMPATGAIIQSVQQTPGAIGYVGLAYLEGADVKPVDVSYDNGTSYVTPSIVNAKNGTYPIVRPLYYYFPEASQGDHKPFLDFLTGTEGQRIVKELGFVPLGQEVQENNADQNHPQAPLESPGQATPETTH